MKKQRTTKKKKKKKQENSDNTFVERFERWSVRNRNETSCGGIDGA